MKTIAIQQPNFLPWLGFFSKISHADVFVILDDVDFQHGNAGSLTNRTRIKGPNGPFWITVPVSRHNPSALIRDIAVDHHSPWQEKILRSIRHSYAREKFYPDYAGQLAEIISGRFPDLAGLNTALIRLVCGFLGIRTPLVLSSGLQVEGFARDERVAAICRALDGTVYLSGSGARKYNRPEIFEQAGVRLTYHRFEPPVYPQPFGAFIPGLSVIDALLCCGPGTVKFM